MSSANLERVNGLLNAIMASDPQSDPDRRQLHIKLNSEALCLRESANINGTDGLIPHVAQCIASNPDPGHHTLGILHLLNAHMQSKHQRDIYALLEFVDKTAYFNATKQFLMNSPDNLKTKIFSAGQSVHVMYADVCRMFAQTAVDLNVCPEAIEPLARGSRLVANGEAILTPCHTELIRVCLKSQQIAGVAKNVLDTPIYSIDPNNTGLQTKDFLLYYYYGGLAYSSLKEWESAVNFFSQCINTPADGLSSIVVEAHKYWCIVSLFLKKGPAPAQSWKKSSGTPSCVQQYVEAANKLYVALNKELREASSKKAGDEMKCNTYIAENLEQFTADNTLGLVKQAQLWIYQRRMQRLTATYLTLSITDIASVVGVDENTVAPSILKMVADGKIFAKIDTTSSMVSFFENPQTYTGKDSIAIMSEKMKECKELAERVANVKATVMTSNKYIENAVIEDRRKAAVSEAISKMDSGSSETMDMDMDMETQ